MINRSDDIDQILHSAGERWRADQPPAPEPDLMLAERSRRQRLIPLIASAAAVLAVVAGVLAVRAAVDHRHDRAATGPASLVVRDGDTAEASGVVIAKPGEPVQFCPQLPIADVGGGNSQPSCGGLAITVTGANLDQLTDRKLSGSTISGSALLRGIYRDGGLRVTQQSAPPPPVRPGPDAGLPDVLTKTPCAPPAGGWKGQPSNTAIGTYLAEQSDQFNGMGINYPKSAVWDPKNVGYNTWVVVVGVSSGDVAQAQAELRAKFGGNICAVRVAFTAAEQQQAKRAVDALFDDPKNGVYGAAAGIFGPVPVQVTVLTPARYDTFSKIGLDELALDVWLKPVR
jgi:hypothetical protein